MCLHPDTLPDVLRLAHSRSRCRSRVLVPLVTLYRNQLGEAENLTEASLVPCILSFSLKENLPRESHHRVCGAHPFVKGLAKEHEEKLMACKERRLRSQELRTHNHQGDALRLGMNWTEDDLSNPQVLVESGWGMEAARVLKREAPLSPVNKVAMPIGIAA